MTESASAETNGLNVNAQPQAEPSTHSIPQNAQTSSDAQTAASTAAPTTTTTGETAAAAVPPMQISDTTSAFPVQTTQATATQATPAASPEHTTTAVPSAAAAANTNTTQRWSWIQRFRTIVRSPRDKGAANLARAVRFRELYAEFESVATKTAKALIVYLSLPRDNRPLDPASYGLFLPLSFLMTFFILFVLMMLTEVLMNARTMLSHIQTIGIGRYVVDGILYKFERDWRGIYGGDTFAAKMAGNALRSLRSVGKVDSSNILGPMVTIVDYKGFRVRCVAELPIDSGTLVYGSEDEGETVLAKNETYNAAMRDLALHLNLKPHVIHGTTICTPYDLEGHIGRDGEMYMINPSRLFCPEAPLRGALFLPADRQKPAYEISCDRWFGGIGQSWHPVRTEVVLDFLKTVFNIIPDIDYRQAAQLTTLDNSSATPPAIPPGGLTQSSSQRTPPFSPLKRARISGAEPRTPGSESKNSKARARHLNTPPTASPRKRTTTAKTRDEGTTGNRKEETSEEGDDDSNDNRSCRDEDEDSKNGEERHPSVIATPVCPTCPPLNVPDSQPILASCRHVTSVIHVGRTDVFCREVSGGLLWWIGSDQVNSRAELFADFPVYGNAVFTRGNRLTLLTLMLRPELVQRNPDALSSDAWSRLGLEDPQQAVNDAKVVEATRRLLSTIIPDFASRLNRHMETPVGHMELSKAMHMHGINMRYLGYVRMLVKSPHIRSFLLMDMLSRVIKNDVRDLLRRIMKKTEAEQRKYIVDYFNIIFGEHEKSAPYWALTIKTRLQAKFLNALTPEEAAPDYDLRTDIIVCNVKLLINYSFLK